MDATIGLLEFYSHRAHDAMNVCRMRFESVRRSFNLHICGVVDVGRKRVKFDVHGFCKFLHDFGKKLIRDHW